MGSYLYKSNKSYLDFQVVLVNPFYWLGNSELIKFTDENIFQWYRLDGPHNDVQLYGVAEISKLTAKIKPTFQEMYPLIGCSIIERSSFSAASFSSLNVACSSPALLIKINFIIWG